jgi:hypothetical protein
MPKVPVALNIELKICARGRTGGEPGSVVLPDDWALQSRPGSRGCLSPARRAGSSGSIRAHTLVPRDFKRQI